MVIKEKIKFTRIDENNKRRNMTLIVAGRTPLELRGRVEKAINYRLHTGWELR